MTQHREAIDRIDLPVSNKMADELGNLEITEQKEKSSMAVTPVSDDSMHENSVALSIKELESFKINHANV